MRLPASHQRGAIPVLTLLGMIILTVGIAVAIHLASSAQDPRGSAQTKPAIVDQTTPTPTPSITPQKKFSDLLQ